ncbi:MAG: FG-GAP repeat domain-containing protein [Vicinamibacterales bacterium]
MHNLRPAFLAVALTFVAADASAQFAAHTVATEIRGGYQVVAADLNRDGRTDLVALGSQMSELVWFENPGWQRHVITTDAPRMINMDAADADGDGVPEIGLAYEFSTNPGKSLGKIAILQSTGDPRAPWTLKEIDAIPTSHRVRWADVEGNGRRVLVNAPILHAKATGFPDPDRLPTPLVLYRPGAWKAEPITVENQGVVHGLLVADRDGDGRQEVFTAGRLGVHAHSLGKDGVWKRTEIVKGNPAPYPDGGASEVGTGFINKARFYATVEPFHGNMVVVYRQDSQGEWRRQVIDSELSNGHSLQVVDLDGDGAHEIVAGGTRGPKNVYMYRVGADGQTWERSVVDAELAANSCTVADINGDKKMDLACIDGTAPFNLKWYENR